MTIITKIVKGKGRGKSILGYATANAITKDKKMDGREGAWYTIVRIDGGRRDKLNAVCGVSKKADDWVLETHILDFDEDIYNKAISIDFIYKIREQIIFKSLPESKTQLEKDIEFVRRFRSCSDCKFCVYQDYGYSNYTVEGTNIYCLAGKFDDVEDSYDGNDLFGQATDCEFYNQGEPWKLDVDGEEGKPSDEWVKLELRDIKIINIIEK
jgi:hypothetical protein